MNGKWELNLVLSVSLNARQKTSIQLVITEYSRGARYYLTRGKNWTIFTQRHFRKGCMTRLNVVNGGAEEQCVEFLHVGCIVLIVFTLFSCWVHSYWNNKGALFCVYICLETVASWDSVRFIWILEECFVRTKWRQKMLTARSSR